ncbi:hypothetical protein [Limnohabitans sp.]|jgi:uncharacterized membrane protein YqhA|uniref:hypothetical protein n=1 Tax=Limnohabitans sp. TaxID=1907725 RepID=UPI0038B9EE1D
MDNGAYQKYKQENPDVYTPLTTYDYLDLFVHQLTLTEWVLCGVAVALAVFALYKIFFQRKDKKHEDPHD